MDVRRWGRECWQSVRIARRAELWLPAGAAIAAVAYALWVGLTGAAVTYLAEATLGGLRFDPWTPRTTAVVLVLGIFWVLGPAGLAVVLVVDRMHNVRDNLRTPYRLHHPSLLLLPPVLVLAAGGAALVATGEASTPVVAVLIAGAVWLLVRTVAYVYRVFALSYPVLAWAITFLSAGTALVAALARGGATFGHEEAVAAVASWLSGTVGYPPLATAHADAVEFAGVPVPVLVAGPIGLTVALCGAYVACQTVAALVARLLQPEVRRPELRTGQRYPEFVRPTTSATPEPLDTGAAEEVGARTHADGAGRAGTGTDGTVVRERAGDSGDGRSGPTTAGAAATDDGGPGGADSDGSDPSSAATGAGGADADPATPGEGAAEVGDHTRVYSPPDDETIDDSPDAATAVVDSAGESCPACGEPAIPEDAVCPACGEAGESV